MTVLTAVLAIGLIIRLTRLIVADTITHPLRARIVVWLGPTHPIATLVCCAWCMSVWIGAAIATLGYLYTEGPWWQWIGIAGTASWLAGIATQIDPAYTSSEDEK
ncbi:membrane protein [Gordonia phage Clown]|uniref:Membrane protein n=1 Tax=Gordonia phage Clown TaxID=2759393 RepID=A0A7L7SHV8_9CAUD|nr:membrane protein [Gordonia phage Clown]QOC56013.1 membrane protein [Gordonia phage Clown]